VPATIALDITIKKIVALTVKLYMVIVYTQQDANLKEGCKMTRLPHFLDSSQKVSLTHWPPFPHRKIIMFRFIHN
jgi:hypothetical protein